MAARGGIEVCKCKRCSLNQTLSFELPETFFPIIRNRGAQEFNVLDQDRCGGAVLLNPNQTSSLLLKQQPLLGVYRRKQPVYPLTHPKLSCSEVCMFESGDSEDKMASTPSEPEQVSYFRQAYPDKGIPEEVLTQLLEEAVEDEKETSLLDTGFGGLLSYTAMDPPCGVAGYSGSVYYSSGVLYDQLSVGALVHPEVIFCHSPYSEDDLASKDFLWCSRRVSPVHAEVVGGLRLPGRACHVDSASVHGRRAVSVRCLHHWMLFEETMAVESFLERYRTQVEEDFISDQFTYDLPLLLPLVSTQCHCQPAAVALSPYHFGEAVVIMETGEMRRWSGEHVREERMREALGEITTQGSPHWWACVYGPHPQHLIVAEQAGLGLIDMRCPHLIKLLTLDSSPNESASDVVTAMKPHPLHPMHYVVASNDRLRLMDIRMEAHPVLSIAHELEHAPQYLDVTLDWQNLNTTILLSGPKCPDTWVANYSGGCAPEGTLIPPPHATALPHMLGCYGNLSTNLHPLLGKVRVKETFLAGLGLISSKGKSLSAIQLSSCGDLFLEEWSYNAISDAPPGEGEDHSRVVSMVIERWCREVDEVEKQARMKEGKWRNREVVKDWSQLMMYVTSDCPVDVCIKCFVYCHTMNKDVKELARQASEAPGAGKKGQCCICHCPLAVGPVCVDDEGEQEGQGPQWPSLKDTFPVGPAEAVLSESELGRKLLKQWPSTSQHTEGSQELSQATSVPQSTEDSLIYRLLHSQN